MPSDIETHICGVAGLMGIANRSQDYRRMLRNPGDRDRIAIEAKYGLIFPDVHRGKRWSDWNQPGFYRDPNMPRAPRPIVGVFHTVFMTVGGTETWVRHFMKTMQNYLPVAGIAAIDGDRDASCPVPLGFGMKAAEALASVCDIAVCWGMCGEPMEAVRRHMRGGAIVHVHHGDTSSGWSRTVIEAGKQAGDAHVAVHPLVAEELGSTYIPNAVDSSRLPPVRHQTDRTTVLWMHRFSAEKYPELAVEACKMCPADWKFVFAGNNGIKWQDSVNAAEGDDRFSFILNGDPRTLLARADLFLSLADMEGFGYSVAEAAAAGVRVASCPVGIAADARVAHQIPNIDRNPSRIAEHMVIAVNEHDEAAEAQRFVLDRFGERAFIMSWEKLLMNEAKKAGFRA